MDARTATAAVAGLLGALAASPASAQDEGRRRWAQADRDSAAFQSAQGVPESDYLRVQARRWGIDLPPPHAGLFAGEIEDLGRGLRAKEGFGRVSVRGYALYGFQLIGKAGQESGAPKYHDAFEDRSWAGGGEITIQAAQGLAVVGGAGFQRFETGDPFTRTATVTGSGATFQLTSVLDDWDLAVGYVGPRLQFPIWIPAGNWREWFHVKELAYPVGVMLRAEVMVGAGRSSEVAGTVTGVGTSPPSGAPAINSEYEWWSQQAFLYGHARAGLQVNLVEQGEVGVTLFGGIGVTLLQGLNPGDGQKGFFGESDRARSAVSWNVDFGIALLFL